MGYDVLCIAETCCDMIFGGLERLPVPGDEEYCREFAVKAGGGSNTAMGLARLGMHTRLLTQLGRDPLGETTYRFIAETGVDMAAVRYTDSVQTAVSAALSTSADRAFASFGGSAFSVPTEFLEEQIRDCRHVHTFLGYCAAFPIAQLCKQYHKTLSLDMTGGDLAGLEEIAPLLRQCSVFTPNDREACRLAGTEDVQQALRVLAEYCPNVVITCGAEGSISCCEGVEDHAPAIRLDAVKDSTGAGDLFCAGYLCAFLNGWKPERRLQYANSSGALAVTYLGGIDAAFTKERVEQLEQEAYGRT